MVLVVTRMVQMKYRGLLPWALCLLLAACVTFLLCGGRSMFKQIVSYRAVGGDAAFLMGSPTSGLSLGEYISVLSSLAEGDTNRARRSLELFVDISVLDASKRLEAIGDRNPTAAAAIRRSLTEVRFYRRRRPRELDRTYPELERYGNIIETRALQERVDLILAGR